MAAVLRSPPAYPHPHLYSTLHSLLAPPTHPLFSVDMDMCALKIPTSHAAFKGDSGDLSTRCASVRDGCAHTSSSSCGKRTYSEPIGSHICAAWYGSTFPFLDTIVEAGVGGGINRRQGGGGAAYICDRRRQCRRWDTIIGIGIWRWLVGSYSH